MKSILRSFIQWFKVWWYGPIKPTPIMDTIISEPIREKIPEPRKLIQFADAITAYENMGKYHASNNNPGAFRFSPLMKQLGAIGVKDGYCIFRTYEEGYQALCDFIQLAAQDKLKSYKKCTIRSFFAVYAPVTDRNNPDAYARWVANKIGEKVDAKLSDFI